MTSKSNPSEIEKISKNFTNKIVEEFFIDKNEITGDQILNLTEFKQLNLFIVKELYKKWNEEQSKIRSPFFNYHDPEVKKSLEDLMNVLSRNILVKKEEFAQLLKVACTDTINLYQDPKEYFSVIFRLLPDFKIDCDWFNQNGKFYKDYGWVLKELMDKANGEFLYANDAVLIVNESINGVNKEDHSAELSEIWKIAGEKISNASPVVPDTKDSNQSFFDSIETYKQTKVSEPLAQTLAASQTIVDNGQATSPALKMEPQVVVETPRIENTKNEELSLNDSLTSKTEDNNSISDTYQNRKIESIKGNISLNQKYLFINNLFDGDANVFDRVIAEIESCTSLQQAKDNVLKTYIDRYRWNLTSPEAEEFFDVLKKRF